MLYYVEVMHNLMPINVDAVLRSWNLDNTS